MFKIKSESELKECFRPLERDEVILSKELEFPLTVKDYLAWTEPSGQRVYLIFNRQLADPPVGIVFKREQSAGKAPTMCEWCHCVRAGDAIGLLSATASNRRRVGLNLCKDLSCRDKLREDPGVDDLPETREQEQRVKAVLQRMSSFAKRELF